MHAADLNEGQETRKTAAREAGLDMKPGSVYQALANQCTCGKPVRGRACVSTLVPLRLRMKVFRWTVTTSKPEVSLKSGGQGESMGADRDGRSD